MFSIKKLFMFLFISMIAVSCESDVEGCTNADAINYNADATTDNGTCLYCSDFDNEEDCETEEHCEWHLHDGVGECEEGEHDDDHDDEDGHTDADGFILELDGEEIYRQFEGAVTGDLSLNVDETLELTVHFLDENGDEIEHIHSEDEEDGLDFDILDSNIISIVVEDHGDHAPECVKDCIGWLDEYEEEGHITEACEWLNGLAENDDCFSDCNDDAMEVVTEQREECAECLANNDCDDDDHGDHEHCEDFDNETDCEASDHCEWHLHDGVGECEDGEHDDEGHDDEHHVLGFELSGLSVGETTFSFSLMHGDHADFTSLPISVTVNSGMFSCGGKQLCLNSCCATTIYATK